MSKFRLGVVLFIRCGGAVLISRKVGSDEWQFPAGGREGEEKVLETAGRELLEELNVRIGCAVNVDVSFVTNEYLWGEEWKAKRGCDGQRQSVVIIDLPNNVLVEPDGVELAEVKFVPKEKLLECLTHEDLRITVKKMMELKEV